MINKSNEVERILKRELDYMAFVSHDINLKNKSDLAARCALFPLYVELRTFYRTLRVSVKEAIAGEFLK